jgi:predicted cupin superfamily sugar epimerase/mannose-6-phosphate isomerase-like protein (cupin superfamily)
MQIAIRVLACLLLTPVVAVGAPTGTAAKLIEHLQMQKIPQEGAWFAGTYRSDEMLPAGAVDRYNGVPHAKGSAIYALVTREDFSALHKLQTDELWHYYDGDPLELLLLHPDGRGETVILGPDVLKGQRPQIAVRRGVWQGARPLSQGKNAYTLFGCTLAPSFEYGDFTIGYRDELQKAYPQFKEQIAALTRAEFARKPAASDVVIAFPPFATFLTTDAPRIDVSEGIELRELAGRNARIRADAYSIAYFTLSPGTSMPLSRNKTSEEVFLVTTGSGEVTLDGEVRRIRPGSVVSMKPGVPHSIRAAGELPLVFYAISSPAFSPNDYVIEPAQDF